MSHSMAERDAEENCRKGESVAWIWNMEGGGSGSQTGQHGKIGLKALFSMRRERNNDDDEMSHSHIN